MPITESIWSNDKVVIPMADVQHIEKRLEGMMIIMKSTRYNFHEDIWDNSVWLFKKDGELFLQDWCRYRKEFEEEVL